jgi:hypothetical protein
MNLRRRVEKLQRRYSGQTITLTMPDGTHKGLTLRHGGALDFLMHCLDHPECAEAQWIRASVRQIDSNGGCVSNLAWALLNSPGIGSEEPTAESADDRSWIETES